MDWLQALDVALFRFANSACANAFFDWLMPILSDDKFFFPFIGIGAVGLLWKGARRGRLLVCLLLLGVLGDVLICDTIKKSVARPRPFAAIGSVRQKNYQKPGYTVTPAEVAKPPSEGFGRRSMPSGHSFNSFCAAMLVLLFYRRAGLCVLVFAAGVAFSRVYNGVHYPSDVTAGGLLGAGYAIALVVGLDWLWRKIGANWFPLWWQRFPSLLNPDAKSEDSTRHQSATIHQHWVRLGYLLIAVLFCVRLAYIAGDTIELSEDEAYQWHWAKHPALSYFSKPPMIAYAQGLGTAVAGDNAFGVRLLSPIIGALIQLLLLRFFAREVTARAGFWLVAIVITTPLLAVGSMLMVVDSVTVLFCTLAMFSGWRAVKEDSTKHWLLTGLWMALGFLSKYITPFQVLGWIIFFSLWKPARARLRRPGPWFALGIAALGVVPVLIWNQQHDWIALRHNVERAGLAHEWRFNPNFAVDFFVAEFGLLNPIFCVAAIWAVVVTLLRHRHDPLRLFLFSMSVPIFVIYMLWTLRARVHPNWPAPAILPLLALMALHWENRSRETGAMAIKRWLGAGVALGFVVVVFLHDTGLITKITGKSIPHQKDPLARVRGWSATARIVETERQKLAEVSGGLSVFIIGSHYGITSELSFYIPESRARVAAGREALVYYQSSDHPENQFYFWPSYTHYKGDSAIYAQIVKSSAKPGPPPERLVKEFGSVTDIGTREVVAGGKVVRTLQLFACRDLR